MDRTNAGYETTYSGSEKPPGLKKDKTAPFLPVPFPKGLELYSHNPVSLFVTRPTGAMGRKRMVIPRPPKMRLPPETQLQSRKVTNKALTGRHTGITAPHLPFSHLGNTNGTENSALQ